MTFLELLLMLIHLYLKVRNHLSAHIYCRHIVSMLPEQERLEEEPYCGVFKKGIYIIKYNALIKKLCHISNVFSVNQGLLYRNNTLFPINE